MRRSPWKSMAVLAAVMAGLSGCGDDPACPCPVGPWADVVLPNLGEAGLLGVAARGTRAVAIGAQGNPPRAIALQTTGGSWRTLTLPGAPAGTLFLGATLDTAARLILVGGTPAIVPVVVDERAGWQTTSLAASGYLNAVAAGAGDSVLAVGTASGGLAATSRAAGNWIANRAGFTTPQEKGLVDVSHAAGLYAACGWDDNTLQPIVRLYDTTGWTDISPPAAALPPEVQIQYRAVCLEPNGALFVGGALVESTGGSDIHTARLLRRTSTAEWIEIVIPDPTRAEAINDILRAGDGTLVLACGETAARVLRWDGVQWNDEGPNVPGQMLGLAEDASGRIYAAGVRTGTGTTTRPILRVRTP